MRERCGSRMRKTITYKVAVIIALLALIILIPFTSVQAASKKEEKAVTKQTECFLNAVKNYDVTRMLKYGKESKTKWYYWSDKNMVKIARKVNKDYFVYEISDVEIKGKTATVKVKYNYYDCEDEIDAALKEYLKWWRIYRKKATDAMKFKKIAQYFLEEYEYDDADYDDEDFEHSVKIQLTKVKGKWVITNIPKKFDDAMDGGIGRKIKYFNNNLNKYI